MKFGLSSRFMNLWIGLGTLWVCLEPAGTSSDYYTSLVGLHKLAKVEQQVVQALNEYVQSLEQRLGLAKKYLEDYETSIETTNTNGAWRILKEEDRPVAKESKDESSLDAFADGVASHPLKTYRLIRRYAQDLPVFEKSLRHDHDKKFLKVMEKTRQGIVLPKVEDVHGATEGLLRVQDAYNVDITEFSQGIFNGLETKSGLTASDCHFIGLYSLNANIYTRAIEWLGRAYRMTQTEDDRTISPDLAFKDLQEAIVKHNEAQLLNPRNTYVFKSPVNENLTNWNERVRVLDTTSVKLHYNDNSIYDFTNFAALCRGEILRSPEITKDLNCWYDTRDLVYILDPIKVEMHHRNPPVLQFYDILSPSLTDRILKQASPFMIRSRVQGTPDNSMVTSAVRTSTTTWINEKTDAVLSRIPRIIEHVTGLNLQSHTSAEELQVTSYGIGGHYNPHMDTLFKEEFLSSMGTDELEKGDRIATIMFYLTEVERGGGTAFPRIGVVAQPVKGSAIFWFNMKRNGESHPWSLHGGCPILYGNKWVANKWIRANSQMLTRKCSMNKEE